MIDKRVLEVLQLAPLQCVEAELLPHPHSTATWIDRRRCLEETLAALVVRLEKELVAGVHEPYVAAVGERASGHGLDPRGRHAAKAVLWSARGRVCVVSRAGLGERSKGVTSGRWSRGAAPNTYAIPLAFGPPTVTDFPRCEQTDRYGRYGRWLCHLVVHLFGA